MNLFNSLESWLVKYYPSIGKENIALILTLGISVGTIIVFGFKYLIKYNSFNSFDLKLLHKKNQTVIPFTRNTFLIGFFTILFLILNLFSAFIIIKTPLFEKILAYVMVVIFSLFGIGIILSFLLFLIDWITFIAKKITKRNAEFTIYAYINSFKNKHSSILYNILVILTMLLTITAMVVIHFRIKDFEEPFSQIRPSEYLLIFIFCSFHPIILFMQTYDKKNNFFYKLIDVSTELPKYNLYLDYFINDNTSLFTSEDNLNKVIKRSDREKR